MADGGKCANRLSEFISKLEQLLNTTEEELISLKMDITKAKRLFCLISELDVVNDEEAPNQGDIQEERVARVNDIESSLEEDINSILKAAEIVRNRAKTDESRKSSIKHSVQRSKKISKKGEQALAIASVKKNVAGHRTVPSTAALGRTKNSINYLRTTYREDFQISKGQQSINPRKGLREIEEQLNNHMLGKTSNFVEKDVDIKLNDKNVPDKRKAVPMQSFKSNTTDDDVCPAAYFRVYKSIGQENSRKHSLLEAILKKAEIPKYQELLEGIKFYHSFERKTGGELHDQEKKLKQKFLEKYEGDAQEISKCELEEILKKLLPFNGWSIGIETCPDLNLLKEIMQQEKDNLKRIMSTYQQERIETDKTFLSASFGDLSNLREYGIWNPSAVLPIFQGSEGLKYLQYEIVKEQLCFQNCLHELQEYQLQIKIFQLISCTILHNFIHPKTLGNEGLENFSKNEDYVRLLLKGLAAIADFSGYLRMPVLACNKNSIVISAPTE